MIQHHCPRPTWPVAATTLLLTMLGVAGLPGCVPDAASPPAAPPSAPAPERPPAPAQEADGSSGTAPAAPPAGAEATARPVPAAGPTTLRPLPHDRAAQGWVKLFGGMTTFGWIAAGSAELTVQDGGLRLAGNGATATTFSVWRDFELVVEYLPGPGTATLELGREAGEDAPPAVPLPGPAGGATTATLTLTVEAGRVSWTDAAGEKKSLVVPDTAGRLTFRRTGPGTLVLTRVELRPIGLSDLLGPGGRDGWSAPSQEALKATWTDKGVHLVGGKGMIEHETPLANFVLQTDVQTTPGTNSGVFFRAIPGEEMNGYELQVNFATLGGDRGRPADGGTGAIFRRGDAREVIGTDGTPVTVTLNAFGPYFATWVEGVAVAAVTDARPPDANPRKGLRTEAGTLQLQGHDATTDATFTRLAVAPLTP